MKIIKADERSYKRFQDILTAYRLSGSLITAHDAGVFSFIGRSGAKDREICEYAGWDMVNGGRFLKALESSGFIESDGEYYTLAAISQRFLDKSSDEYQGAAISFEKRLVESWATLPDTLKSGRRIYGIEEKNERDYKKALDEYLGAMDDAALIRAEEMWKRIRPCDKGLILDAGAGSGAFITSFLKRNRNWQGIFCDLGDVIESAKKRPEILSLEDRLLFYEANLFEMSLKFPVAPDLILISNLLHCQGDEEAERIFKNILNSAGPCTIVIIHDFFSDCGWRGALYDIHMMLNTFSGRTFSTGRIERMLTEKGLTNIKTLGLDSGSTLLIASKKALLEDFIL